VVKVESAVFKKDGIIGDSKNSKGLKEANQ
jgi:hypothetical protein